MRSFNKLITHFIGNSIMWLFYGGKKSIDEVAKKDNSTVGLIVLTFTFLVILGFKK